MGHSCHVEPVSRGELAPGRAEEIARRINAGCGALDWHGGEGFRVEARDLLEGRTISTKVAADADADGVWGVICQCVGAALWLSRELPEWVWEVTDDLEIVADGLDVGEVVVENGRVRGEAGEHARVLEEIGRELGELGRTPSLDQPPAPPAPAAVARPSTVLGALLIEKAASGQKRLRARVPLQNHGSNPVDVRVAMDLEDAAEDVLCHFGVWTLASTMLAAGESRMFDHDETKQVGGKLHRASVLVQYVEEYECPAALLVVEAPQGQLEVRAEPIAAPLCVGAARLTFGADRVGGRQQGEQELMLELEVETAFPGRLRPRVRFYNTGGSMIRDIRGSADVEAGAQMVRVPLVVRKMERFGSVSCVVDARLVVREEQGVLRLVTSEKELLAALTGA